MTINHSLKQLIRARMRVTGETYTQARRAVLKPHSSHGVPAFDSFLSHDEFQRFESLFVPSSDTSAPKAGLHLFVGETGSGKSTALKSLADYYESKYPYLHTLVIGDSYDFVESDTRVQIDARQVPERMYDDFETELDRETHYNRQLLRSAMRMRADVTLYDTLYADLEGATVLANSGATVGMTFFGNNEQSAIQRLYEHIAYESKRPQYAFSQVAYALQSITTMHQRVVDGVRIAVTVNTPMTDEGVDAALSGKYERWSAKQGYTTSSAKLRMVEQFRKAN
jgi:Tfp pilus assembly ATPase PilU